MKSVKLKTYTWTKDSHKLFDYECPNLYQNKILTNEALIIARNGNDVIFHDPSKGDLPSDHTMLCILQKDSEGRFYLESANPGVPLKLAIRSIKSKGSESKGRVLKPGDKVQIGRVEYFVREIKDDKNNVVKADNSLHKMEKEMDLEETKEAKHCRICLEEEHHDPVSEPGQASVDNVFISPCLCKGTSKYVHINCLREWVKSKKQANKPSLLAQAHRSMLSNMNIAMYFSSGNASLFLSEPFGMSAIFQNWASNLPGGLLHRSQRLPLNLHQHFLNIAGAVTNLDASLEAGINQNTTTPADNINLSQPTLNRTMTTVSQSEAASITENSNNTANPTAPNSQNLPNLLNMMQTPPVRSNSKVENHEFSNFCCDVCKESLPFTIKLDNETEIDTVNISRPEDVPYMILEKISIGKEPKMFYVLKATENQKILLGRGHSCDIMIPDISVSRSHAFISYQDGKFVINDNNSKFGTLLKLEDSIEILNEKLEIQCGRTLITVEIKNQDVKMECESLENTIQNNHKVMILCKRPPLRRVLDPTRREKAKRRLANESDSVITQEVEGLSEEKGLESSEEKVVPELNSRSRKIGKHAKRGA